MNGDNFFVAFALVLTFLLMPAYLLSEYYYEWKARKAGQERKEPIEGVPTKEATVQHVKEIEARQAAAKASSADKKSQT